MVSLLLLDDLGRELLGLVAVVHVEYMVVANAKDVVGRHYVEGHA